MKRFAIKFCYLGAFIVLMLLSGIAWSQPVWDITDSGLYDVNDIGPVVNHGLATQQEHGLPVYIPHGWYSYKTPIVAPFRSGGSLLGAGRMNLNMDRPGKHHVGMGTVLTYTGNDPAAMSFPGEHYVVGGFNLLLKDKIGILVDKPKGGIGTGKHTFDGINIDGASAAFQAGSRAFQANCDNCRIDNVKVRNCGSLLRTCNVQAMGWHIRRFEAEGCKSVVEIECGGDIHLIDGTVFNGPLFSFPNVAPKKYASGRNHPQVTATRVKADAQHRGNFQIVHCDPERYSVHDIIINQCMVSGGDPWNVGRLSEKQTLVLRDFKSTAKQVLFERVELMDRVHFDNCKFNRRVLVPAETE